MVSIITAVHNQLPMNMLFHESLQRYSSLPFELIIVDNNSTDGTREYFESVGVKVIKNSDNYSYGYCQNQGIEISTQPFLAFLNNDVILPPDWDKHLIETMEKHSLDVVTVCSVENMRDRNTSRRYFRKWQRLKHALLIIGGASYNNLSRMHRWMYGDWKAFSSKRYNDFKSQIKEGFVGCGVMMRRDALEKIGRWDPRVQGADFDLYLRTKERSIQFGDVKPCHIALDVFVNHYIRITLKSKPPQFANAREMISIEEKWGARGQQLLADKDN